MKVKITITKRPKEWNLEIETKFWDSIAEMISVNPDIDIDAEITFDVPPIQDDDGIIEDLRIRTVRVLGCRAKEEAIKQGCKDEDLVIVKTIIRKGHLPEYKITKIIGSPTQFLYDKMKEDSK